MPAETLARTDADAVLRFEHVTKVYCGSLKLARTYAFRDVMWTRRDRAAHLRRGEWVVLRDINLEVARGQTLLVLGVSGSGKSTLADLITGRRAPDTGTIARLGSVGVIAEGKYGQNPLMRLGEYLRLMAALQGVDATRLGQHVDQILEWTSLGEYRETMVIDLPKHLLKPVARVGCLLADHDLYVVDNYAPFGNSPLEHRMAARFAQIQATRTTVVLTRGPQVPDRVDQAVILHGGEIIYSGEPQATIDVYDRFVDHARVVQKRRGAGSGRGGALHHQPTPPVDEALTLIRDLLGAGGPSWSIDKVLERLTTLQQPFLIGPCLTNLSWEVLFWLPFVKWVRRQLGALPPAAAVSRCAVGAWYDGMASAFVDIYDLMTPEELQTRDQVRARTRSLKQIELSDFERDLLDQAAARCGFAHPEILHPSLLLGLATQIWRGRVSIAELAERSVYEPLQTLDPPPVTGADYTVACFPHFVKHFPDVPENRTLILETVRAMRLRTPVVLLSDLEWLPAEVGLQGEGHAVEYVNPTKDPRRRHRIEAATIAGARAVIGTMNGPVTLAPFSGVPAICIHPVSGGMLDFNIGALRQAAEQLGAAPLATTAVGAMTTGEMGRWLDGALEARATNRAEASRA